MIRLTLAALAIVLALTGVAQAAPPPTLVVDDDKVQCAKADFTSIQPAVDEARDGYLIRVCPGKYSESVTVDKPLTLKGDPEAVDALECLDPAPSQPWDLDPAQHAILDGKGALAPLVDVQADDVTLSGLVVQAAVSPALLGAIETSDQHAGYRIAHNLIRLNTVGIQFGAQGANPSRFDHNCLRQNGWGLATDGRALVDARVDHNETFDTDNRAFEPIGGRTENAVFDHNHSRQDTNAYLIRNSNESRIFANVVESSQLGIVVGGGLPNTGLSIVGNQITTNPLYAVPGSVQQGIAFPQRPLGVEPNSDIDVYENVITAMRDGIVAAGPPNFPRESLVGSRIFLNVTSDSLRDGIVLRGLNTGNSVSGNSADRNARYGIYAQGAIANVFAENRMLGNGVFDARDEKRAENTWVGNACLTDDPKGSICGGGVAEP